MKEVEPWCNHDAAAVVDRVCECGAVILEPGQRFAIRSPGGVRDYAVKANGFPIRVHAAVGAVSGTRPRDPR